MVLYVSRTFDLQSTSNGRLALINSIYLYIDDILITSTSEARYINILVDKVPCIHLKHSGLVLKLDKHAFMLLSVECLGLKISVEGLWSHLGRKCMHSGKLLMYQNYNHS